MLLEDKIQEWIPEHDFACKMELTWRDCNPAGTFGLMGAAGRGYDVLEGLYEYSPEAFRTSASRCSWIFFRRRPATPLTKVLEPGVAEKGLGRFAPYRTEIRQIERNVCQAISLRTT